jgi:hypothetical protein
LPRPVSASVSASVRETRSIDTFSRNVSVRRAITATSEAVDSPTASGFRPNPAKAAKASTVRPTAPKQSGTAMKRRDSGIVTGRRSAGCQAANAISNSPAVQPMSNQAGAA